MSWTLYKALILDTLKTKALLGTDSNGEVQEALADAAGVLTNDGAGALSWEALALAFADLTDYPADAAGFLENDGAGNLSWGAGGGAMAFADLTDYPADAAGALTNDGAGNLSWSAAAGALSLDQTTPETITGGIPLFDELKDAVIVGTDSDGALIDNTATVAAAIFILDQSTPQTITGLSDGYLMLTSGEIGTGTPTADPDVLQMQVFS